MLGWMEEGKMKDEMRGESAYIYCQFGLSFICVTMPDVVIPEHSLQTD